jgi:glycosyltransferase involved in cell wall biosynthesis
MSVRSPVAVHVTTVHSATDTRIFVKQCTSLHRAGFRVALVAPGERDQELDGIYIAAVRMRGGRLRRMTLGVASTLRRALRMRGDIYHLHDPELVTAALALRGLGKKVVVDVHEDIPGQILSKSWVPRPLRPPLSLFGVGVERLLACAGSAVVTATPTVLERFPASKRALVQNYPILDELSTEEGTPYALRPAVVAYVGGVTAARGIVEMTRAMALLPTDLDARLAVAGVVNPPQLLNALRAIPGADKVELLGWQNRTSVRSLLARARLGIVVFHPVPNHVDAQPTKLFEYMSVGIPVVAADFPRWRDIVQTTGCGLMVDPLDPADIARAIRWLLENPDEAEEMGRKGREAVRRQYNWEAQARTLVGVYERLLSREHATSGAIGASGGTPPLRRFRVGRRRTSS